MELITCIKLARLFLKWIKNRFGLGISYLFVEESEALAFHFGALSLTLPSWLCLRHLLIPGMPLAWIARSSRSLHVLLRRSVRSSSGAGRPSEHTSPKLRRRHFLAVFLSQQGIFQIRSHWCIAQNQNSFVLFKFDHSMRKVTWTLTSLLKLLSASAYGPVRSSRLNSVKSQLHQLSVLQCFSWNVYFSVLDLLPLESSDLVRLGGFIFKVDF